jgi:hypothetical protein
VSGVDEETGIWKLNIAKKRHKLDLHLATAITDNYFPERAADLGCGIGHYCTVLKAFGWPIVHGYDGTENIKSIALYNQIWKLDLTTPVHFEKPYDFVLFLEVGEHVPEKHEQTLIDNVARAASDVLVASWAPPGQYSASGHVNCKPRDYIIEEFEKRGLRYRQIRSVNLQGASSLSWFKTNIMEFKR